MARPILNSADVINGLRKRDPRAAQNLNECFVPSIWRFVFFVLAAMRAVAKRRIHDHYRAAARVRRLIEHAGYEASDSVGRDPATVHDEALRREGVRDAMERLPDLCRSALEWKYVDRLSVKQIATRLDATEKSTESTLFRARQALRDLLYSEAVAPPSVSVVSSDSSEPSAINEVSQKQPPSPSGVVQPAPSSSDDGANHFRSDESSIEHSSSMLSKLRLAREN